MTDAIPLQELLVEELRDLYNAETRMIRALPHLTKTDEKLTAIAERVVNPEAVHG